MDNRVEDAFKKTRASVEKAMKELREKRREVKYWNENKPNICKCGGIYVFWNAEKAVYVGRARNILRRYNQHFLFNKNQSPLALKFAKEALAKEKEKEGDGGKKYLIAHYGQSNDENKIRKEIEDRLKDNDIKDNDIKAKDIKERMNAMKFSFYKEKNTLQQYLLEIFCSIGLGTVILDKAGDEVCNIEEQEENGESFYRYKFYNSFRTS